MSIKELQENILRDARELAERLGSPPTIDQYLREGKYPREHLKIAFRSWDMVLAALAPQGEDLTPKAEQSLVRKIDAFSERLELESRWKRELAPFIGKYEYKPTREILRIAASSDHHSQFLEPALFEIYLDHIKRMQPEVVALVGDVFDFWGISRYDKDPGRALSLQSEIDFVREKIFKEVRKACPDSQIDFFLGNHEARLYTYLASQARGLSSLRCLQFHTLFGLEDYKINLVARPSYLTPTVKPGSQNYKIYGDCFVLAHGTSYGKHPAQAELDRYNKSGASGHVHRNTVFSKRDLDGCKTWTSLGTMASLKVGDDYIPDLANWQQGYQIQHINLVTKKSVAEYVNYNDGFTHAGGVYYETAEEA